MLLNRFGDTSAVLRVLRNIIQHVRSGEISATFGVNTPSSLNFFSPVLTCPRYKFRSSTSEYRNETYRQRAEPFGKRKITKVPIKNDPGKCFCDGFPDARSEVRRSHSPDSLAGF